MQRVAWYYEHPEQVDLQKIAERRRLGRTGEYLQEEMCGFLGDFLFF